MPGPGTVSAAPPDYLPGMPARLSASDLAEVWRVRLLLERVQAMPAEVLEQWAAVRYGPPESREKAAMARRELTWRQVGGDVPFR